MLSDSQIARGTPNDKRCFMKLVHFTIFVLLLIDAESATAACASSPHSTSLVSFTLNSDATKIAAAAADGTIVLWDAKSGSKIQLLECHSAPISTMAFSPDSSMLALGDAQGIVTLWDVFSNRLAHKFSRNMGQVEQISFSEDGKRLAASDLGTVRVWQLHEEKEINSITNEWTGGTIALNRDGTMIAVGGYGKMALWDVSKGQLIRKMGVQEGDWVDKLVFARNDLWIISAQGRKGIVVWDAQTGGEVKSFSGQTDNASFAVVSPDASTLLSMADDGTLRSWDLDTSRLKSMWKGLPGFISADGRFLLRPSGQPGRLELWRIGGSANEARFFTYKSPLCQADTLTEGIKQSDALQNVGMGESKARDGTHLSFTTYVTPDCTTVTITQGEFTSEQSAAKELSRQVKEASGVIEQGANKDFLGRTLGERAVLSFADTSEAASTAAVIWTEANQYYDIRSSSVTLALSLEKRYRHR
jgi:WD40 repeat protein